MAWYLDETSAPAPKFVYTRAKPGACAGTSPEVTVRRLIGLMGAHDRDAVLDCFSLEVTSSKGRGLTKALSGNGPTTGEGTRRLAPEAVRGRSA